MEGSFQAAHRRVSIHRMIQEYGLMFDAVLEGAGVKGFEEKLTAFGEKWENEKLWQKDENSLEFDLPRSGGPVSVLITVDGYDPVAVSFEKGTSISDWEIVTAEGSFPVKDRSDIYIVRTNDQPRVTLTPRSIEFPEATMLQLRVDPETGMRLNVVRSGLSPVKLSVDKAENKIKGGIDARNITVERQGSLVADVVSNKALEEMLMNAPGVQGIIVGIKPIPDLFKTLNN
jgi:hypothetical protein